MSFLIRFKDHAKQLQNPDFTQFIFMKGKNHA